MKNDWQFIAHPLVLQAAESIINSAIDNEQATETMQKLEGTVLIVHVQPPGFQIGWTVADNRVRIIRDTREAQLRISGSLLSLSKLALAEDKQGIIESEQIRVDGTISHLYTWRNLLQSLHIDWEYQLAQKVGAMPAKLLVTPLRAIAQQARDSLNTLPQTIRHSLLWHKLAVDDWQLQELAQQAHELRNRVEEIRRKLDN